MRAVLSSSRRNLFSQACSSSRNASTLVVAEHDNSAIFPGTLAAVTAASKIGGDVTLLVAGHNAGAAAEKASKISGVAKVLHVDNAKLENPVAEDLSTVVMNLSKDFTHIVSPSSNVGKNFMPRVAALCDSSPLTDVSEVVDESTFKRPMYAGNAIATVQMKDALKFLLIRTTAFEKAAEEGGAAAIDVASVNDGDFPKLSEFTSKSVVKSERPELSSARVVISGGRGMKNGENFEMLTELADKLGGAVGASRAAVDAGFVPNEYQVGQTGKVVAPDLYVAVGISGAIQHLSGMKDSKVIVAINKDKDAPIHQVADYGLVEDLFKVVPDITAKL
jgi:electron transfer flavoprotein alpha subunit